VLHRLDEAKLWGAPDRKLDRLAAGLFYDASRAPRLRLDARAERLSVAATRLAFCASPATARWLVQQEAALFAARLRLGEREVPGPSPSEEDDEAPETNGDGATSARRSPVRPCASRAHRWVAFERATGLVARREPGVVLRDGRARVPDALVPEVLVADHRRETEAALAATARRRRRAEAEARGAGAFGTPAAADALAKLVTWRPKRPTAEETAAWVRAEREASRRRTFAEAGSAAPATEDVEDLASPPSRGFFFGPETNEGGREGRAKAGWCRGWRRRRREDGGDAPPATSLSVFPDAGRAFGGADSAFGRLPVERFEIPLGSDAKRALRVIRKGPRHAVAGARPYPLCVRRHLAGLHRDHHLRHEARFQLTLFFKGIDLSAEETLHVWRAQFGHGKMNDFQNEHRYHVRHAYGLEGKMADYPPLTCEKLARRKVEPNGAASCPFAAAASGARREREEDATRREPFEKRSDLSRFGSDPTSALREEIGTVVPPRDAERIARVAAGGNAREACRMFFRATHAPNDEANARGERQVESRKTRDEYARKQESDDDFETNRGIEPAASGSERDAPSDALRDAASLEDLKFPHDYYDRSARVEEETKRFAGGAGGAARRRVALEMEDDTDESDADEGGDLPGHRDH
jgi:DNA primase large subunit